VGKIRLITCSLDGGECSVSLSGHFTTRYLGGPCVPAASEVGRFADVDRFIATRYRLDGPVIESRWGR